MVHECDEEINDFTSVPNYYNGITVRYSTFYTISKNTPGTVSYLMALGICYVVHTAAQAIRCPHINRFYWSAVVADHYGCQPITHDIT